MAQVDGYGIDRQIAVCQVAVDVAALDGDEIQRDSRTVFIQYHPSRTAFWIQWVEIRFECVRYFAPQLNSFLGRKEIEILYRSSQQQIAHRPAHQVDFLVGRQRRFYALHHGW